MTKTFSTNHCRALHHTKVRKSEICELLFLASRKSSIQINGNGFKCQSLSNQSSKEMTRQWRQRYPSSLKAYCISTWDDSPDFPTWWGFTWCCDRWYEGYKSWGPYFMASKITVDRLARTDNSTSLAAGSLSVLQDFPIQCNQSIGSLTISKCPSCRT